MKKFQQVLSATIILITCSNPAWGNDHFDPFFEVLVMAGITTLDTTDTSLQVGTYEVDTLTQTNDNTWNSWTGQLGVGYVYPLTDELSTGEIVWFSAINPQLNIYYLGNGDIAGDVYLYQSAEFNQMDYQINYDSTRFMFDLGLTVASIDKFSIYAITGAGVAWNNVDFGATPNQEGLECGLTGYDLARKSSTSFAYEFGGGITFAGSDRASISLEYLYTVINDVKLGEKTSTDFILEGSNFDVHSQAVLLGLRYAI